MNKDCGWRDIHSTTHVTTVLGGTKNKYYTEQLFKTKNAANGIML